MDDNTAFILLAFIVALYYLCTKWMDTRKK